MNKLLLTAGALIGLATSAAASAATYVGTHSAGPGSVQLSITTDDTIGVLAAGNITAWSFTMTGTGGSATIDSSNSQNTFFSGTALSATATDLVFDFSGTGHIQWDNFNTAGDDAFCIDTDGAANTCSFNDPSMNIYVNGALDVGPRQGRLVLGNVANAVPEPATWAMMILGFLAVGGAMRRSRPMRASIVAA